MRLTVDGLFAARWTDAIHEEWIRGALRNRADLSRAQLERTRDLMNRHARECIVTGYESLIPSLILPDLDDRHVLAAAIHAGAEFLVTFNLADFPDAVLSRHGIVASHPDDFVLRLLELNSRAACELIRCQRQGLRRPPMTAKQLVAKFVQIGLPRTAERLRQFADQI